MAARNNKKNSRTATRSGSSGNSGIRLEIILCVVLAVSVILFISNFGIAGRAGEVISTFTKGVFGIMAYPFPVVLFFGYSFYVANRDNPIIIRKIIGLVLLFIFVAALFQLLIAGTASYGDTVADYYKAAGNGNIAGGVIGGVIVWVFSRLFGFAGALILIIIGIIISLIVLTQRRIVSGLQRRSSAAIKNANARRIQRSAERKEYAIKEETPAPVIRPERKSLPEKRNEAPEIPLVSRGSISGRFGDANGARPAYVYNNENEQKGAFVIPDIELNEQMSIDDMKPEEEELKPVVPKRSVIRKASPVKAPESVPVKKPEDKADKTPPEELDIAAAENSDPDYILPSPSILSNMKVGSGDSKQHLLETAAKLQDTLRDFGVNVTVTNVSRGPAVTRYELQPEHGVKVSRILSLTDDIKLNLAAADIRIEAPIAGKAAVGIEVPNKENSIVPLKDMLISPEYESARSKLSFCVGKDLAGKPVIGDIQKMPHLLIAGATGSGKSVCINTLIVSVLFKAKPEEVKMIMIDPKVIELSIYNGIPHLLLPVVTDPRKAASALNWAVGEMTRRYRLFSNFTGVRDLKSYNDQVRKRLKEKDLTEEERAELKIEPQILIIVDELADLMMVAQGEVESAIVRITQLARAAGIHLVVATQRPSVNVITGLIKANMPSRIAFAVTSGVDSRTIIDMNGAERLLGKGDMLYYPQGASKPMRVQGSFVSDEDVAAVVKAVSAQKKETEDEAEIAKNITETPAPSLDGGSGSDDDRDQYFWEAGKFIIEKDKGSIGMLQRMFKIGFNRAARIMDQLHEAGVVGEEEGTKPRKILMTLEEFEEFRESETSGGK